MRRLVEGRADLQLVGEASEKSSALAAIAKLRPELLLLDIQMPGGGFELINAQGYYHRGRGISVGLGCIFVTFFCVLVTKRLDRRASRLFCNQT